MSSTVSPVVGHQALRRTLAQHQGSFALIGPASVGKRAVVTEWAGTRPLVPLHPDDLDLATRRPGLLHLLDADDVTCWANLLRPLEEATFPVVVLADRPLPAAVTSRLPVFRAGYLTDAEVTQVLAEHYPRLTPRPLIARLAQGSLDNLDTVVASAQHFTEIQEAVEQGRLTNLCRTDPLVALASLRSLCRAVLGLTTVPVTDAVRKALGRLAAEFLRLPVPTSRHEARNLLSLFLARLRPI